MPEHESTSREEIMDAVERLAVSPEFVDSPRLVGFVRYVVGQTLDGLGDRIKAKTIGIDFYGYSVDEIEDRESVVRVDAGRVRRKLDEYHSGSGANASIRLDLPKGSYVPVISRQHLEPDAPPDPPYEPRRAPTRFALAITSGFALVGVVTLGLFLGRGEDDLRPTPAQQNTSETTIFDVSPKRVEAINLARHGQDMIFPATDQGRLMAALAVFESAVQADADFHGGYAGAGLVQALRAFTNFDDAISTEALAQAVEQSDRAVALAPNAPFALASQAFTKLAAGEPGHAQRLITKAAELDTTDVHVAEVDALISLFTMDFGRVLERIEPFTQDESISQGYVFDNALGSAHFNLGQYEQAIEAFERGIGKGGPFGPVPVAYLMAARHEAGQPTEAKELATKFMETWPDARVDILFRRLYIDDEPSYLLERGMRSAGWRPRGEGASSSPDNGG